MSKILEYWDGVVTANGWSFFVLLKQRAGKCTTFTTGPVEPSCLCWLQNSRSSSKFRTSRVRTRGEVNSKQTIANTHQHLLLFPSASFFVSLEDIAINLIKVASEVNCDLFDDAVQLVLDRVSHFRDAATA